MVAGGLVSAMFGGDISNVNTILVSGTSIAQGLFIEMFLTAQLVFVILMLAVEKSKDTFMAPIGIGLALFVAELSGKFLPPPSPSSSCTGLLLTHARVFVCMYRRLFHWWLPQPSSQLRLCRRRSGLSLLPLDILARTSSRSVVGGHVLPLREVGTL